MLSDKQCSTSKKKKTGRPTKYSEEMAALICERIATHSCGIMSLCKKYDDMPVKSVIYLWLFKYKEFSDQYARAKQFQVDLLAEECLDIADEAIKTVSNGSGMAPSQEGNYIASVKLGIDVRKWLAGKLLPKKYGQNVDTDSKKAADSLIEKIIDKL